jgi:hypothetical protein
MTDEICEEKSGTRHNQSNLSQSLAFWQAAYPRRPFLHPRPRQEFIQEIVHMIEPITNLSSPCRMTLGFTKALRAPKQENENEKQVKKMQGRCETRVTPSDEMMMR